MSRSQHVLKVQKDGVTYTCEMYTTPQEARDNLYAGQYVRFNKDGTNLYVPLTPTLNSDTESTPLLMYKKGDNTKYCIAQKSFYRANVTPTANAVITAKAYNEGGTEIDSWTSGAKWFPYGTRITASGVGNPSNIWNNPSLSIDRGTNAGETMTVSNVEIGAASAVTRKSYSFTLNPGSNQTVTIKYTQPGATQVSVAVSGSTRTFTVQAGTTWTASITATTTGFNAGRLNITSGTITGSGVAISATSATRKTYTLKLNGTSYQTITLRYTQPGSSQVTRTSTGSAQSWTVGYGTTWSASLSASAGYTAGSLSGTSGTVTGDVTVSATAAKAIYPVISFTRSGSTSSNWYNFTITYTNTSGSRVTTGTNPTSVTIRYNTTIVVKKLNNPSYAELQIYQGSTYKATIGTVGGTWTSGGLTGNTTFRINGYNSWDPEQSGGEGDGPGGGE